MNSSKQAFAPLYLWGAVFLLVGLFFGGLYTAFYFDKVQDSAEAGITAKLSKNVESEWAKVQPVKPLIIGVGSSLLQNGYDAPLLVNGKYQPLVFFRANASFDNFGLFFQRPLQHKPALIIVQTDLFFIQHDKALPVFWSESRLLVAELIRKLVDLSIPQPVGFNCRPMPEPVYNAWRTVFTRLYSRRPEEQTGLIQWIRIQQRKGIKVVLLDMPRSPSSEIALAKVQVRWRQQINQLARQLKLKVLRYPGQLSDIDFCDGSHMAPVAGAIHTHWLDSAIQELLREPA